MSSSIPSDAFEQYLAMGSERSYSSLADKLGVSKQAVVKRAKAERWQERLDAIESKVRENTDKKAIETLEELNDRWLKVWGVVERRALETLRNSPMPNSMDAVRALDIASKHVRLIRGEPTERTENLEAIVRREHERWAKHGDEDEWADRVEGEQPQPPTSEDEGDGVAA